MVIAGAVRFVLQGKPVALSIGIAVRTGVAEVFPTVAQPIIARIDSSCIGIDSALRAVMLNISGNIGLGTRFYLNETIALRFDYRQYFYSAEGGGLSYPAELTLGVSFFTAAPE